MQKQINEKLITNKIKYLTNIQIPNSSVTFRNIFFNYSEEPLNKHLAVTTSMGWNLTFFQLKLISWMATLIFCLIWQIISFISPPNAYGCVYASLNGPAIDLQKMPLLAKNYLFRWSSFWYWWVCKQAKLSYLGHRKPARIHWN